MVTSLYIEKERLIKSGIAAVIGLVTHLIFALVYSGDLFMLGQNAVSLLGIFVSFTLIVYFISKLFELLSLPLFQASFSLFLYLFLLFWAVNSLGHIAFQTGINQSLLFYYTICLAIVKTALILFMFKPKPNRANDLKQKLIDYISYLNKKQLSLRLFLALLLLFLSYYFMSTLLFPFIEPYYANETILFYSVISLEATSVGAMLIHAVVVILITLPVIISWNGTKNSLLFWLGFPMFLVVAVHWLIFYGGWPIGFRFPVFIHLTLTLYIQAIIVLHTLYVYDDEQEEEKLYRSYSSI